MRDCTTHPPADAELAVTALRYAAGDMDSLEAEGFEIRLADDQAARDALAEAVRLSAAASGAPTPTPDPLRKQAVTERLHPTLFSRLFPRRPYRGHPLVWAGLGGGIAAAVAVTLAVGAPDRREPQVALVSSSEGGSASALVDGDTVIEADHRPRVNGTMPTHLKLNPMGLENRATDAANAAYPTPLTGPPTPPATVIVPTPAPKPAEPAVAEVQNEADPMGGEPHIGMMMSKL
jgi:hypothetical protein